MATTMAWPHFRYWHFSDLLTLPANVGYEGKSGSGSDIDKPTRLTHNGSRSAPNM